MRCDFEISCYNEVICMEETQKEFHQFSFDTFFVALFNVKPYKMQYNILVI